MNRIANKKYSPKYVVKLAQQLRLNMTPVEKILWSKLCNRQILGMKFRNQHPIERYIVDFYCHEIKLIIEVDGTVHDSRKEYDDYRDNFLKGGKYTVLRFSNDEIENSIESVLHTIENCVSNLSKEDISLSTSPPSGDIGGFSDEANNSTEQVPLRGI